MLNKLLRLPFGALLSRIPVYRFANIDPKVSKKAKFLQRINLAMKQIEENRFDLSEQLAYFKEKKWEIKFDAQIALIEYSKDLNECEIKVLVKINPSKREDDIGQTPQAQTQIVEKGQTLQDVTQLTVFYHKKGTNLWLVQQFVATADQVQKATMFFTNEYKGEPVNFLNLPPQNYVGPDPASLSKVMNEELNKWLQSIGINGEVLANMSVLAANREQELLYGWMKNLRDII